MAQLDPSSLDDPTLKYAASSHILVRKFACNPVYEIGNRDRVRVCRDMIRRCKERIRAHEEAFASHIKKHPQLLNAPQLKLIRQVLACVHVHGAPFMIYKMLASSYVSPSVVAFYRELIQASQEIAFQQPQAPPSPETPPRPKSPVRSYSPEF